LQARAVQLQFMAPKLALRSGQLRLEPGGWNALWAPMGPGKRTLMATVSAVITGCKHGDIRLAGVSCAAPRQAVAQLGVVCPASTAGPGT